MKERKNAINISNHAFSLYPVNNSVGHVWECGLALIQGVVP